MVSRHECHPDGHSNVSAEAKRSASVCTNSRNVALKT